MSQLQAKCHVCQYSFEELSCSVILWANHQIASLFQYRKAAHNTPHKAQTKRVK